MNEPKPQLLVALSDGFAMPRLLARRLDTLVSTLGEFEVALLQDKKGIARAYFEGVVPQVRDLRSGNKLILRRYVEDSSHVVVFWSGEDLADVVFYASLLRKKFRIIPVRLTSVKNKDKMEEFDVYIGRGGPWGNPFPIRHGPGGDSREDVIRKYKKYFEEEILTDPDRKAQLLTLRGYRLGCHCKPEACHGDIIAEYLNSYEDDDPE
ncbi:DUF4326 domain-containing protein [Burkholderia contaminans]|uniref:DUF4326 domain-containing protein n=1 Tax=Burkholderia contaminans TaxID=488447 RepID=UPI000F57DBB0|nr:DUF4326 domain-containing protein [Burkholderia contaminans]RQT24081.1 DUF4326 domain-containing protein [Burkholderia contaminans]